MSAYLIVRFTPKDLEKLQQYAALVPPILARYSGEIIIKGPAESLYGDLGHPMQMIVAFPSREDAQQWYHCSDYQDLIPLRNDGMDSQFQLIG